MKHQRHTIKQFLHPARAHKKTVFLVLIHTFVRSWWWYFLLTFNKNIAIATELGESSMVIQNVRYFVLVTIVTYLGVIFIEKQYDFLYWKAQQTIYTRYITKLMEVDNNQYETLGTGYINSVLWKWADKRSLLLQNLFINGVSFFFELCFAFILIFTAAWWIGVGLAWTGVIISLIVMERWTRISMPRRRKKRAIFGKLDKHIVRIIMSKFEILINNKQTTERNNLAHGRDTIMQHHHHDWRGIVVAYVIPRLFNEWLRWLMVMAWWYRWRR
jgi:ABC-type multidrug transport system fused ATPase/permease subunit